MTEEGVGYSLSSDDLRSEEATAERRAATTESAFEKAQAAKGSEPVARLEEGWLGRKRRRSASASELDSLDAQQARAAVKLRARDLDVRLKRILAIFVVAAVGAQLVVADLVFAKWMLFGAAAPSDTVVVSWLSATVVEVIGIVAIVARNLFPDRGRRKATDPPTDTV